jgi:hypothetical protein
MTNDLLSAGLMLAYNSLLFYLIGRWSVTRTVRWRIGGKILDDINSILERRQFMTNDLTITHTRGWRAHGFNWKIRISQEEPEVEQ